MTSTSRIARRARPSARCVRALLDGVMIPVVGGPQRNSPPRRCGRGGSRATERPRRHAPLLDRRVRTPHREDIEGRAARGGDDHQEEHRRPRACTTPRKPLNLLPTAVAKNQLPMVRPTKRFGVSLVMSDSAIGDKNASPTVMIP